MLALLIPQEAEPYAMTSELRHVSDEPPHVPVRQRAIKTMNGKDTGDDDVDAQDPS
jgi:hypothetical protein